MALNGTALTLTGGGTVNPGISGSGSLRTTASMILAGINTYTGSTTIEGGVVQVTGSLANNGSNKVFVSAGTDFTAAAIVRQINVAGSYAGMGSTAKGTSPALLGSRADILAGVNSGSFTGGGAANLSMAWRLRATSEMTVGEGGSPASPPLPYINAPLISDVLQLTGMASGSPEPSQSDPFALQMTYKSSLLADEANDALAGSVYLAWLNPDGAGAGVPLWQNAVAGNFGNNATPAEQNFQGSFAAFQVAVGDNNLADYIGAWGVDTANDNVWAVVNHDSQFAVVPEPATLILALLGAAGVGLVARRRRK
jgi:autotransporter-associated beta strand protein